MRIEDTKKEPEIWVGFIFGLGVAALLYWRRYRRLIRRIRAEVG